jgi:hypothetical protein
MICIGTRMGSLYYIVTNIGMTGPGAVPPMGKDAIM